MNKEPLPVDKQGNGSRIKTLEFDEADAYMLMRALSIAVNTAMMCSGKESVQRLTYYKEQLRQFAPSCANRLRRPEDLCEIAILATTVETWSVYRVRERQWSSRARTVIKIGNRFFASSDLFDDESTYHQEIVDMIKNIVPLTCSKEDHDDVIGNPWSFN